MTTMEIPRQLRKAASIIEKRGHRQYVFGSPEGPVCLASALAEADDPSLALRLDFYHVQPLTEAGKALIADIRRTNSWAQTRPIAMHEICGFNNRTSAEGVVEQLRTTADKLEKEEQREAVVL